MSGSRKYGISWKGTGLLLALLILFATAPWSFANVEWDLQQTFKMDQSPLDVAVAPDGKHVFVLTGDAILIYDKDGRLEDKIPVESPGDRMILGPRGKRLFITNKNDKTVQVVRFDFVHSINISGSPHKGRQDAPVVLAIFSDFQ